MIIIIIISLLISFAYSWNRYSRRILWLKVGTSNNDPSVIAYYFLSFKILKGKYFCYICIGYINFIYVGTPQILQCDMGTENSHLAFLQPFLRRNGVDCFAGEESFRYGRSVSNQVLNHSTPVIKK